MSDVETAEQEPRTELYDLIRSDLPFKRKAREVLRLGQQYLDAGNAHLTRIDREADHWQVVVSTDAEADRFAEGTELDLGITYCRKTLAADTQLSLHDAPNQGWEDDPAFEALELHCYQGTTLVVDGEL